MAARTAAKAAPGEVTKVPEEVPVESRKAPPASLSIFERINLISQEAGALAPEQKGGVPFAFRGVDGTVAHLTPFMHKYGVFVVPAGITHIVTEREVADKQGNPTGRVVKTSQVEQKWDVYGPDGYGFTAETAGLADDFADRSTAQAQSVAYRVALLQIFHLPTHDKEPEERGEEVQRERAAAVGGSAAPETKTRGQVATDKARAASAPAGDAQSVTVLQNKAKALGRKLGKGPDDLNALGTELAAGTPDWFGNAEVLAKIVEALEAEAKDQ